MNAPETAPVRTRWGAVVALGLAMLAVTSEITIAAVALPGIGSGMGVGPGATAWVMLAYTVPMAALGIPAGRWGDRADPRPVFLIAQAGLLLGTAATVLAPTFAVLIGARVLQGIAGALVVAVYMPIVTAAVAPERRGSAISVIITIMTVGAMAGAPIGGLVADAVGWRAVFLVKVPAVLAAVVTGAILLDRRRVRGVPLPDRSVLAEAVLLGGAVTALLLALEQGAGPVWQAPLAAVLAVALLAGWSRLPAAAAVVELVRRPRFGATLAALLTLSLGAGLSAFLVPWFVTDVVRGTAATSGAALLAFVAAMAITSPVAGRLTDRFGALRITVAGGSLSVLALAVLLPLGDGSDATALAWRMALFGIAAGVFNPAVNAAVLAAAPAGAEGATGGIAMTVRTIGAAVGPAAVALGWTLTGGGTPGWRLGIGILLVAAAVGTLAVLRPALRAPA
ncbi:MULTISPECIES: MFS transporter [Pseudonocardia]|uniref:Multidrug resistance protein stp n=2 Tax=Pseudonocardia TaxID=1847 RepID=A0A1Y2N6I3_PSEAH|nr:MULTISPECIES: MFS transporter [Pseudonocardia]OSY43074.1 Multidrug resistance protein stp [Pseudonocardia autotrophica]TDN71562.1 MFS transporter [Pseudonocardia autotrophica]BBG02252.1 MFS transporter [Pseudonocardia autotrophica]GEC23413.1 MFS transporter [Pseudonocardia saturnea]